MSKVLCADDDLEALELIKMAMEMAGHEVTTAFDGKQALSLGLAGEFDAYILDVMMPHMDGYHVAEQLSEKYPNRVIILLTSRDFDHDRVAIEACGADAHMSKPFDINELLRVVKNLTDKKNAS